MREPWFWRETSLAASAIRAALAPAAAAYATGQQIRIRSAKPTATSAPLICIGNATVGGSGKTPFCLFLADALAPRIDGGVAFLSKGYGGAMVGPHLVEDGDDAAKVGDEPILLARRAPTVVARMRARGAAAADALRPGVIVMDDGFQNPTVAKDAAILLVSPADAALDGPTFPAGPYREPLRAAARRADLIVIVAAASDDRAAREAARARLAAATDAPIASAVVEATPGPDLPLDVPLLAFCGLARPEKFFASLDALGVALTDRVAFPDHHPYSRGEIEALIRRAAAAGAGVVTTEKDHVRIDKDLRKSIFVLPAGLQTAEETAIVDAVLAAIKRRKRDHSLN